MSDAGIFDPQLIAQMTEWRRDFHRHPEPGFAEERTAERVAALLESFRLEVHRSIGKTGVVGILQRGNGAGEHRVSRRYGCTAHYRDRHCRMGIHE